MTTQIDGITYLLATDQSGHEWVQRYTAREMLELFTSEEVGKLTAGETVTQWPRRQPVRFTDMVAATRKANAA